MFRLGFGSSAPAPVCYRARLLLLSCLSLSLIMTTPYLPFCESAGLHLDLDFVPALSGNVLAPSNARPPPLL